MYFRLTPRSMTLDYPDLLQLQILSEFRGISQIWEATTSKRIKIDVSQRQRCNQCFLVSCFNFSFSISPVDENLLNFSCSFSHLLVLVIQVSHQNECDHTTRYY